MVDLGYSDLRHHSVQTVNFEQSYNNYRHTRCSDDFCSNLWTWRVCKFKNNIARIAKVATEISHFKPVIATIVQNYVLQLCHIYNESSHTIITGIPVVVMISVVTSGPGESAIIYKFKNNIACIAKVATEISHFKPVIATIVQNYVL